MIANRRAGTCPEGFAIIQFPKVHKIFMPSKDQPILIQKFNLICHVFSGEFNADYLCRHNIEHLKNRKTAKIRAFLIRDFLIY